LSWITKIILELMAYEAMFATPFPNISKHTMLFNRVHWAAHLLPAPHARRPRNLPLVVSNGRGVLADQRETCNH
jgi:hypothetical protein